MTQDEIMKRQKKIKQRERREARIIARLKAREQKRIGEVRKSNFVFLDYEKAKKEHEKRKRVSFENSLIDLMHTPK